jgi:hypothetical protein
MIQQSHDVIFGYNAGAELRTLKCDVTFSQLIEGEIDEDVDWFLSELFDGRRKGFKCDNFFLTTEDCFWLVNYILAVDKTIEIDSIAYDVVNTKQNLDKYFDLIKNLNARAKLDLAFEERALAA